MSDNNDYSDARSIDDDLEFERTRELALKRLVSGLIPEEDTLNMGLVESVARIVDRIDKIAEENERLRERVGKLEADGPHTQTELADTTALTPRTVRDAQERGSN